MEFEAKAGGDKSKVNANYRYNINNVNFTYVPVNTSIPFYFEYKQNKFYKSYNLQLVQNYIINSDTIKDMVIVPNPNGNPVPPFNFFLN